MSQNSSTDVVINDGGNQEKNSISASTFVRTLTVTTSDDVETTIRVAQRDVGEEGVVVWDAALVLAFFLERHREQLKLGEDINVVELGAGTGVVGLVSSALGARCTLTDLDRLIPLLEESISLNDHIDRIQARPLHWGDPDQVESFSKNPPDLILVADCVYYEASVVPLVVTLETLSSFAGCPVLLSYEVRDDFEDKREVKEKFFALVKKSFRITEFQTSDCHPEYAADDIKVVRLDPIHDEVNLR
jgi:predicted nicotinamide N-methyase